MSQDQSPRTGGCACGNLTVRLTLTRPAADTTPRQCACAFCKGRDAAYVSDPAGAFEISVADETQLRRHRFATATAEFLICRQCCGYVGAVCETVAGLRGVINIRCLEAPDAFPAATAPDHWDGETPETRLARRARNWTPATIRITAPAAR